eukprot:1044328-Heterocapsa_arctica.AAC.1
MPFARGRAGADLGEDHTPESKRRKALGDIDFGGDVEVDESDAAMDVLLSLGISGPDARRTISEVYSPPRVTRAALSHPSL